MSHLCAAIVTHNSDYTFLKECVDSFNRCKLSKSLYIHDNNSRETYRQKLQDLKVDGILDGPNKGYGFGNNKVFQYCQEHKYFLVLNPDVIIPEGTLERLVQHMDKNPGIGLISPKILYPDGRLQMLNKRDPGLFNLFARRFLPKVLQGFKPVKVSMDKYVMKDIGYDKDCEVNYISGSFMLFRKEAFEKVGGFDERFFMYLEDADISRRVRQNYQCRFFSEAHIYHHWNRGSYSSWRLTMVSIKSTFKYFNKWGWAL